MKVHDLLEEKEEKKDVTLETKVRRIFRKYAGKFHHDTGGMKGLQKKTETWSMDFAISGVDRKADISALAGDDDEMAKRIRAKIASRKKEVAPPQKQAMFGFLKELEDEGGKEMRFIGFTDGKGILKSREDLQHTKNFDESTIPLSVRLYFDNRAEDGSGQRLTIKPTGPIVMREVEKVLKKAAKEVGLKPHNAARMGEDDVVFTISHMYEGSGASFKYFVGLHLGDPRSFDWKDGNIPIDKQKLKEVMAKFKTAFADYKAQVESFGRIIVDEPEIKMINSKARDKEVAAIWKKKYTGDPGIDFPVLMVNVRDLQDEARREKHAAEFAARQKKGETARAFRS